MRLRIRSVEFSDITGIGLEANLDRCWNLRNFFINSIRALHICNSIGKVNYENNVQISHYRFNVRVISLME